MDISKELIDSPQWELIWKSLVKVGFKKTNLLIIGGNVVRVWGTCPCFIDVDETQSIKYTCSMTHSKDGKRIDEIVFRKA